MPLARNHPRIWLSATAAAAVLAALGLLAGMFGSASRSALLGALERPAPPALGTPARIVPLARAVAMRDGQAVLRSGSYSAVLRLSPNRASAANHVLLTLSLRGRALRGAAVILVFGMPAMGMSDAYSSPLAGRSAGSYGAAEPVLGMPGLWQLRLRVVPAHGAPFALAADDVLVG
jgi:hypothetical protein